AVNVGRFGPYIRWGEQFISIPKTVDLHEMSFEDAIDLIEQKQQADAPIAEYDGLPVTKGKGRFGPFIKWNDLFINVPKAYVFDNLTQKDVNELIEKKLEKESKRFIQQWPTEKIAIENGRWGPFIRFQKKMLKLPRKKGGDKYLPEDLVNLSLEEVKDMIEEQVPGAFKAKKKASAGSASKKPQKAAARKSAVPRKTATKKTAKKQ
ncbi:MAG: topoisomerase C-terminal repeat-containing protein, partial [Bacteroidota bacterium]